MNKHTWYTYSRRAYHALSILIILAMMLAPTIRVNAYTYTDKPEYTPGSIVTISGDNTDADAEHNFSAQEPVVVDVVGPNGYTAQCEASTDDFGAWSCTVTLWEGEIAYGEYIYTATGQVSGNVEYGIFLDGPPKIEQLWQCDPPSVWDPATYDCVPSGATGWVSGNNDGPLYEGDTVPYRTRLQNLIAGDDYSITIEWDTTKAGLHALDYLKSYNATILHAEPCAGLSGLPAALCSGSPSTWAIPADTFMQADPDWGGVQDPGEFTMFGGEITGLSGYTVPADYEGDTSTSITVYFTAGSTDIVLAWGGHIAERADWGMDNSAVFISGSPYHMRILSWYDITNDEPLNVGSMDRSLSADAVIYPGQITIIKHAIPPSSQIFGFTASPTPLYNFDLVDNSDVTDAMKIFEDIKEFKLYTIDEVTPAGWDLTGLTCEIDPVTANGGTVNTTLSTGVATIDLKEGEFATCTYTNEQLFGWLKLVKTVINDDGGTLTAANFPAFISGVPATWDLFYELMPGAYTASETPQAGYTPSVWSGDCAADGSVTVEAGVYKTCYITNDDIAPTLKLVKTVTNNDGGTAVPDDWTLYATGTGGFSNLGGSGVFTPVMAGVGYVLSESAVAGYLAGSWSCDGGELVGSTITLDLDEDVTCTINNNDIAPTLKLVKTVTNNDGGTAVPDDWTLYATGTGGFSNLGGSGVFTPVMAGVGYVLSESAVAGYLAGSWSCDGGVLVGSTITLDLDEDVTCTINNNDIAPTLKLVKTVTNNDGGTAVPDDWTLYATGTGGFSNLGGSGVFTPVMAGVGYVLSESMVAGYLAGSWSCDGGELVGSTITLDLDEDVTCTINNNDIAPTLKLVKTVTNNDGGTAVPDDWTLTAAALASDDGRNFFNLGGSGVFETVFAGVGYDLSESMVAGYLAGSWSCDGGELVGSTITLDLDEDVTCTINNNDIAPTLKLVKTVTNNDGGTAVPDDWTLYATGTGGFSNLGGSGVFTPVMAGVGYVLSESAVAGYLAGSWSCDGGELVGSTITLDLDEDVTCTINNNDIAPTLKLVKTVTNNDGGTAVPDDWTLYATGTGGFSNLGGSGVFTPVMAGVGYVLSESAVAGYLAGSWSCDGGELVGSTITLDLDEDVTCTINNNDIAPTLKLVKTVTNNDGGTAVPDDWTLYATGTGGFSNLGGSGVFTPVMAGVGYVLSESMVAGYLAGSWSCDGGELVGSTITLDLDEDVTCTINNNDIAPTLKLVKTVTNNDGGTAVPDDWTLTAAALAPDDGRNFFNLGGSGVFETVFAGVGYDLSESMVAGYLAGSWSCDGGELVGSTITLDLDEDVTCTINNNDIAPTLKLVKTVTNNDGGTAVPDDWTLTAAALAPDDGRNFFNLGGSGVFETVFAGVGYDLSESMVAGYLAGSWSCDGGELVGSTITLDLDEDVTCTINNNDIAPTLKLVKVVVNDSGGTATAHDWTLYATGTGGFSNLGDEGVFTPVYANTPYILSESGPAGYNASAWVCDGGVVVGSTITLGLDEDVTCTITNNDMIWAFTPGFWKNHTADAPSGHDAWQYTNYMPTDPLPFALGSFAGLPIKGSTDTYGDLTMWEALSLKGGTNTKGALEILLRAGTASVLNASFHEKMHGGVEGYFPYSVAELITMVDAAIASHDRDTMLMLAAELDYLNNGYHYIEWWWDPNLPLPQTP